MSLAELERAIQSKRRVKKAEAQEKASFDYVLADLIGRSVGRLYGSNNNIPDIVKAYPTLFNSEEIEQEQHQKKMELSSIRFRQFAQFHNKKFSGGADK